MYAIAKHLQIKTYTTNSSYTNKKYTNVIKFMEYLNAKKKFVGFDQFDQPIELNIK